ncbi:TetR/AcrR family transcriptional regulator, partial [Pseudomonas aeruginosa]
MKKIRQRNLQLILDAACEVFADCGFSAARLSDVAERAGVAKANVLYYYRSKAQLYEAVLDSIVEPLLEASRPFAGGQPPAEALRAYVDNKMRIGAERPHAARVFSCEIMRGAPRMPAPLLERLDAQAERNAERIRQWIDEGLLAPLDPYHL